MIDDHAGRTGDAAIRGADVQARVARSGLFGGKGGNTSVPATVMEHHSWALLENTASWNCFRSRSSSCYRTAIVAAGDFWFGANALILDSGLIPANGERALSFVLLPIGRATPTILQAAAVLLSGEIVLGPPTGIVLN